MGASTATVKSTGGNFSALAGAPQAEIVLPVANALLYLNTNTSTDGWAASDVGDYTNYATGEAASGRLIQTPGPITAGVSFGNYAIVFKGDAIYRLLMSAASSSGRVNCCIAASVVSRAINR
jgi:hypothetical protein